MPQEHPEQLKTAKSHLRHNALVVLVILLCASYLYYSATHPTPISVPTSSSTTTAYHFSIQEGDLYYAGFGSCWYLNKTDRIVYALFFGNVTNRLNLPTDYVNASFYAANLTFSNEATVPSRSQLKLIAGPSHAVNLTFTFGIPVNGSAYHQILSSVPSSSYLVTALLSVQIFISQSGHVEKIPMPEISFSLFETPACSPN